MTRHRLLPRSMLLMLVVVSGVALVRDVVADSPNSAEKSRPHWLWSNNRRAKGDEAVFERVFDVDRPVAAATMRCLGESSSVQVELNGEPIVDSEAYDPIQQRDLTDLLARGSNNLRVTCGAEAGPAAFFLLVEILYDNGTRQAIASNRDWRVVRERETARAPTSFGLVGDRLLPSSNRAVGISAVDNYEQWKQALGAKDGASPATFALAAGFEIDLIRSAKPNEDSWVSLAFDSKGRAVIAKEKQGLMRMTLSPDRSQVVAVDSINDGLKECRGLLFAHDSLFVNANNSKGLFRLRRMGEDKFGEPELLYASDGGVGHGRNDLALGPDGWIYTIQGDSVHLPTKSNDTTSPFRAARRGKRTSEGHLLRVHPETGRVEVVAAGLRNPFGVDFNSAGDAFTYDADAEYDMGSPWYRPTRVSHLVLGGDYGWRGVTKTWPPYYPDHADNALPNLDIGKGSPTAVKFGAKTHFPERYRDALYILDWAYGRVIAVHQVKRGSSYVMAAETFLKGRPLNVTDLDVGPDGSMYLVTGGRATQSALYRIRYVGDSNSPTAAPTKQQLARAKFVAKSRRQREKLESLLKRPAKDAIAMAWPLLGNSDPWLRHAARNVIEREPVETWRAKTLGENDRTASVNSILALARSGESKSEVVRRLNQIDWAGGNRSDKLAALQSYWLSADDSIDDSLRRDAAARVSDAFPDRSYRVNRLLSELLVRLHAEGADRLVLDILDSATIQREQMHYLFVLRHLTGSMSPSDKRRYFARLSETRHYLGGAGIPDFIRRIREESTAGLTAADRKRLGPLLSTKLPNDETDPPRDFVRKWQIGDLQKRLAKVEQKRDLKRGAEMFAAASCSKCHRAGGRGGVVGPDLTSVSRRFSRLDLLTSILEPSKVIAEKYRSLQVATADGRTLVGQVVVHGDYRSPILRLATDPLRPSQVVEIAKNDIEQQKASPVSWMPEGLLDTLSEAEILDLLAYLESLK